MSHHSAPDFRPGERLPFAIRKADFDADGQQWWLVAKCKRCKYVEYWVSTYYVCSMRSVERNSWTFCIHSSTQTINVRIVRLLLSDTKITVRADDALFVPFNSTVGTPHGDSLSPVLFVVYLDAALRTSTYQTTQP